MFSDFLIRCGSPTGHVVMEITNDELVFLAEVRLMAFSMKDRWKR